MTLLLLISLWAAAAGYTVYWHAASTGLPSDVESLAAAPASPAILYAGTWGQGVYRSTDHGAAWQPASTGITLPLSVQGGLAVNPVTPTVLYREPLPALRQWLRAMPPTGNSPPARFGKTPGPWYNRIDCLQHKDNGTERTWQTTGHGQAGCCP